MTRTGLRWSAPVSPEAAEVGAEQARCAGSCQPRRLGALQIVGGLPRQCADFAHSRPERDDIISRVRTSRGEHLRPLAHVKSRRDTGRNMVASGRCRRRSDRSYFRGCRRSRSRRSPCRHDRQARSGASGWRSASLRHRKQTGRRCPGHPRPPSGPRAGPQIHAQGTVTSTTSQDSATTTAATVSSVTAGPAPPGPPRRSAARPTRGQHEEPPDDHRVEFLLTYDSMSPGLVLRIGSITQLPLGTDTCGRMEPYVARAFAGSGERGSRTRTASRHTRGAPVIRGRYGRAGGFHPAGDLRHRAVRATAPRAAEAAAPPSRKNLAARWTRAA